MKKSIAMLWFSRFLTTMLVSIPAHSQIIQLPPSEDATLSAATDKTHTNFGLTNSMTILQQPGTQRGLVKFDIGELKASGVQAADVQSALVSFEVSFNDGNWANGQA